LVTQGFVVQSEHIGIVPVLQSR